MEGWIKIHRSILNWELFRDPYVLSTWLYLLLSANNAERNWNGKTIGRGQLVTSVNHLAADMHLNRKTIMRVLNQLVKAGCITHKYDSSLRINLITIVKYEEYQVTSPPNGLVLQTDCSPSNGQVTSPSNGLQSVKRTGNQSVKRTQRENNNIYNIYPPPPCACACEEEFQKSLKMIDSYLKSNGWTETKAKALGITPEQLRMYMQEFRVHVESEQKSHRNGADLMNNFVQWLNIRQTYEGKPQRSTKPSARKSPDAAQLAIAEAERERINQENEKRIAEREQNAVSREQYLKLVAAAKSGDQKAIKYFTEHNIPINAL